MTPPTVPAPRRRSGFQRQLHAHPGPRCRSTRWLPRVDAEPLADLARGSKPATSRRASTCALPGRQRRRGAAAIDLARLAGEEALLGASAGVGPSAQWPGQIADGRRAGSGPAPRRARRASANGTLRRSRAPPLHGRGSRRCAGSTCAARSGPRSRRARGSPRATPPARPPRPTARLGGVGERDAQHHRAVTGDQRLERRPRRPRAGTARTGLSPAPVTGRRRCSARSSRAPAGPRC